MIFTGDGFGRLLCPCGGGAKWVRTSRNEVLTSAPPKVWCECKRCGTRAALLYYEEPETALGKPCPCEHTEPCHTQCTCVVPSSSSGCARCCRYGSPEQQKRAAERLSDFLPEIARLKQRVIELVAAGDDLLAIIRRTPDDSRPLLIEKVIETWEKAREPS